MSAPVGRATIVDGGPQGSYTVSLDYGVADVAAKVAAINAELLSVENALAEQATIMSGQEAAVSAASALLDSAISVLRGAEPAEKGAARGEVTSATESLAKASLEVDKTKARIASFTLTKASLEGQIAQLDGLTLTETRQAWCADYTEDAAGLVATIEINGEQPLILVAPGADAALPTDGAMKHRLAVSPSSTYFNAALLPGWQKFQPTYRTGGILSINRPEDTCSVALDAALSSAQDLNINQTTTLDEVPIEYMNCNSRAFNVGDDVVVKFEGQDWTAPKVIGFKQEPRACGGGTLRYIATGIYIFAPEQASYWFAFDMEKDYQLLEQARTQVIQGPGPPYPGPIVCEARVAGDNDWILFPHNNTHFYNSSLNIIRQGSLFQGVPGYQAVRWGYDLQFVGVVLPGFDLFDATGEIFNLVDEPQPPNTSVEDNYYFAFLRNIVWALGGEHNSPLVVRFSPSIFDLEWPDQENEGDPRQLEIRIRTLARTGVTPRTFLHVFIDRDTQEIFNAEALDIYTDPIPTDVGFTGETFLNPSLTPVALDEYVFPPDGGSYFYSGATLVDSGV